MASFIEEIVAYINKRFSSLHKKPHSHFTVFDPREMPQHHADLAIYGSNEVLALVQYFQHFLSSEERQQIILQWPFIRARLSRQRMNKLIDVFSNLLMSKPDDVKDCLILNDLLVTLSPSTAKCECGFSSMNQLKSNLRTSMGQDTLQA